MRSKAVEGSNRLLPTCLGHRCEWEDANSSIVERDERQAVTIVQYVHHGLDGMFYEIKHTEAIALLLTGRLILISGRGAH